MTATVARPLESLSTDAGDLRLDVVNTLARTGGGHYGANLSVLDILLTLYTRILRVSPATAQGPERDRLVLSKGHAALALYAVLRRLGFITSDLAEYGQEGSPLQGHPDMRTLPGIDFSTGSLGQGLSVGLGIAMALRASDAHAWVVLGDGECQEGQVWEAAMVASAFTADNLHAVIDANGFQEYGLSGPGLLTGVPVPALREKWEAFGWRVLDCDGHDHGELERAMRGAATTVGRPSIVIARTTKGKGFRLSEDDPARFHCTTLSPDEHAALVSTA